jgi:hypothetical protein
MDALLDAPLSRARQRLVGLVSASLGALIDRVFGAIERQVVRG